MSEFISVESKVIPGKRMYVRADQVDTIVDGTKDGQVFLSLRSGNVIEAVGSASDLMIDVAVAIRGKDVGDLLPTPPF